METQALSKQVSIEDFVSELRKFPEPAFDRTDQILKFLESTLGRAGYSCSLFDLGSTALHPQPDRQNAALRTDCGLLGGRPGKFGA